MFRSHFEGGIVTKEYSDGPGRGFRGSLPAGTTFGPLLVVIDEGGRYVTGVFDSVLDPGQQAYITLWSEVNNEGRVRPRGIPYSQPLAPQADRSAWRGAPGGARTEPAGGAAEGQVRAGSAEAKAAAPQDSPPGEARTEPAGGSQEGGSPAEAPDDPVTGDQDVDCEPVGASLSQSIGEQAADLVSQEEQGEGQAADRVGQGERVEGYSTAILDAVWRLDQEETAGPLEPPEGIPHVVWETARKLHMTASFQSGLAALGPERARQMSWEDVIIDLSPEEEDRQAVYEDFLELHPVYLKEGEGPPLTVTEAPRSRRCGNVA